MADLMGKCDWKNIKHNPSDAFDLFFEEKKNEEKNKATFQNTFQIRNMI